MIHISRMLWRRGSAILLLGATLAWALPAVPADAASSKGCDGGGFVIKGLNDGSIVGTDGRTTIPAGNLGPTFRVDGKYVDFAVSSASFGVENWALTGAPNPLDLTGNRRTIVFASKTPDHRGLALTGDVSVDRKGGSIVLTRAGAGVTMKIQANDCASGGVFQMEVERADGSATRFTHVLADGVFYFDNPNFRAREGYFVPFQDTTVQVTARINFGNDVSALFVGRDSPQVATRIQEAQCVNQIATRLDGLATVRHCGAVSRWDVASGGRMGQVMGEDAVEVAPPATVCVTNCTAQNRVRGQAVVLGFPFPVPLASRLLPLFPPGFRAP